MRSINHILLLTLILLVIPELAYSQYFGKNKPRYRSFDFKVEKTPHFDIYTYMDNPEYINHFGELSEMWYQFHNEIFHDSIVHKNPIILYNNHADFQQTNAISGAIGVGTGGVTEAFKNRVVLPATFSEQQTSHVLGHELVHAFQYNTILQGDSTNIRNLANLPLWMVEGLAEYMSIGRYDPFTAMWMRDAVIQDDIPTLRKLNSAEYFPYRYGQAVWAFVAGLYGDQIIHPWFKNTAVYGLDYAIDTTFNTSEENLSNMWKSALVEYYTPFIDEREKSGKGTMLISEDKNGGRINVSPSLSPDGRFFVFLSEKDVFNTDLFIAETRSGEITSKLTSLNRDAGLDHLNLLESGGSWSPDSKKYVFVAFKKGRNVLVIKDIEDGGTETMAIPDVPAFESPIWSADGREIIVTGKVEGQVDLYAFTLRNKRTHQLTDDKFSELHANLSPEGDKIVFSYDRRTVEGSMDQVTLDLAVMDINSGSVEILDVFHGANNLNPQYDSEGNIYFVSDRDGFRDMYQYNVAEGQVYRMTNLATGISGITQYSPAITVAKNADRIVYSTYFDGGYQIYRAGEDTFLKEPVPATVGDRSGGFLPVKLDQQISTVDQNVQNQNPDVYANSENFERGKYRPKFKLDYVGGGAGVGVSNNTFGTATGLQGGIDMIFSDILGNNQLYTQLALNGDILDFGGQVSYLNRKNRLAFGFGLSHIPLRTGYESYSNDQIQDNEGNVYDVLRRDINLIRIFGEGLSAFVHYPFSTRLRLEGGIEGRYQSFRQDRYSDYYQFDNFGRAYWIGSDREKVETGDEIRFNQYYTVTQGFGAVTNVALVGDNSYFGLTAPLAGYRFRLSAERSFGINDFTGVLVDGRYYHRMSPFTLAFRGTTYSRFEGETNSLYPFYIGDMGFVRGYGSAFNSGFIQELGLDFGQLIGSKIALGSVELRLPFTGPKQLALIGSNTFFTDLNIFLDAGVAFDEFSHLSDGELLVVPQRDDAGNIIYDGNGNVLYEEQRLKPAIASSVGVSLRVNLFGAMILEPYYAWSLEAKGVSSFGLNFIPGW